MAKTSKKNTAEPPKNNYDLKRHKALLDDLQNHRKFIQKLYREAAIAIGVLAVLFAAVVTWVFGETLDEAIQKFHYDGLIDKRVTQVLGSAGEILSLEIEENILIAAQSVTDEAVTRAQEATKEYIDSKLASSITDQINAEARRLNLESLDKTLERLSFPEGAVIAFDLEMCPNGWDDFAPAYGRFVRGIDRSGNRIDPAGSRRPGSEQEDDFEQHSHSTRMEIGAEPADGTAQTIETAAAHRRTGMIYISNRLVQDTGGLETRPKNVSLLYCRKT